MKGRKRRRKLFDVYLKTNYKIERHTCEDTGQQIMRQNRVKEHREKEERHGCYSMYEPWGQNVLKKET